MAEAVDFILSPGVRSPAHTGHGFGCVDEDTCDEEKYFVCAQSLGGGVDYLACQDAASGLPEGKAKACASSASLDFDKISMCFGGQQGTELLTKAADHFDQRFPQPVGVPRVEVNGNLVQERTYDALIQDLCATGIKAGACNKMLVV
mmetsp:Transcript_33660/g.96665  ORF Transcript_33660/g.96665 Transcript_33660/m.96665 type:complete len:147 (+) Transcript_33660:214-654(+)